MKCLLLHWLLLFAGVFLLAKPPSYAQGIRRSVICSAGGSATGAGSARLYATTGQPPNAGTIQNAGNVLRQGFQQPASCASAPQAIFEALPQGSANCGGTYRFRYLDTPDPNTQVFWTFGIGAQPPASYDFAPPEVSYLGPGQKMIILEVLTEGCRSIDTLFIDVNAIPMSVIANVANLWCREEDEGGISLFTSGGTSPYSAQWSNGASGLDIDSLGPGNYAYTVTDANGCTVNGSTNVTSPDSLSVDSLVRGESCIGSSDGRIALNISGGTAPYTYFWQNDAGQGASLSNLTKGLYAVTVSDANDCKLYLEFNIASLCDALTFYDVFSPNGDGQNDRWVIEGIENFPNSRLSIFDRWGQLVFETTAYANNWEGTRNDGSPLPLGAYFFMLRLGDNSVEPLKGSITLIR
jgi:gliding motility-associated-like protein